MKKHPMSAKDRLEEWIKKEGMVRTSDVQEWGKLNNSNRARRNANDLAQEGVIERLDQEEANKIYGYKLKERVWVVK